VNIPEIMVTGINPGKKPTGFYLDVSQGYNECENDNCGGGFGDCSDCGADPDPN